MTLCRRGRSVWSLVVVRVLMSKSGISGEFGRRLPNIATPRPGSEPNRHARSESMRQEVRGAEQALRAGRARGGQSLIESLPLRDVPVDLVSGPDDVAVVQHVVAQCEADRGGDVIADLDLAFRDHSEPGRGKPPLIGG